MPTQDELEQLREVWREVDRRTPYAMWPYLVALAAFTAIWFGLTILN